MKIHIKTLFGLENVLAEEIDQLGGQNVKPAKRSVNCEGDMEFLYKANLNLRTALKILVPVHTFRAQNETELYQQVMKHDWSKYLSSSQTFAIDNTVRSEYFRHSKYAALKTKDAIVDQFRNKTGKRPSVDVKKPDVKFDLYAFKDQFTISLDSSGEPLNKRGYRFPGHEAPINEVLAAGMLKLAGWEKRIPLYDPMCGTGTILIEAALMGQNIPPQISRHDFAFKNWNSFHLPTWNKVISEAKANIRKSRLQIFGGDIDGDTILIANKSLRKMKLSDAVDIRKIAIETHRPKTPNGLVITNPPYGERIGRTNTNEFYKSMSDILKNHFSGFDVWLISSNMEALKHFRLRPSKKIVLFNGSLECKFEKYEMYTGSRK